MAPRSEVKLVPWDPESNEHVARLVKQRVQCGWHANRADGTWRREQREGSKCIFWIVLDPNDADSLRKLEAHWAEYPEEQEALIDSSNSLRGTPRTPTLAQIHPVGHISLDDDNLDAKHLGLDLPVEGTYWIKSFFVSKAMQGKGVGRVAMDHIETMAVDEPLCAKILVLDTMNTRHEENKSLSSGNEPARTMSNMAWYERRGYRIIRIVQSYYNTDNPDESTVFMRRDLS